jgi:hypothetical protein
MSSREAILEHFDSGPDRLAIDRATGVIRGVKLLGERSANPPPRNNVYPRSTREKAKPLFEGARVFVNHPPRREQGETRPYQEGMGFLKNVIERGDGLYGDWHFNPKHTLAEQAFWDAEHNPRNLGFSINGEAGRVSPGRSGRVVEEIAVLASVDLVSRPATTNGLFESRSTPVKKKLKELIGSLTKRPGYVKGLKEAAESGILGPEYQMDAPATEEPAAGGEEVDHEQAIRDAAKAVLDDSALDTKQMLDKIRKLLAILDDDGGGEGGGEGEGEGEGDDEIPTEESRKGKKGKGIPLSEKMARLEARDRLRTAADEAGVKLPKAILECVHSRITEAEAKALVAELKGTGGTPAPKGGAKSAAVTEKTLGIKESLTAGGATQPPAVDPDEERRRRVAAARSAR